MDEQLIQFGDIFRHNEKEYIFLAQSDVIYAALILDEVMTSRVSELSDKREVQNSRDRNNPAFAIVILETDAFKDRGAHFARTDGSDHQVTSFDRIGSCNRNDLLHIREEILSEHSIVPLKLIEIVGGLKID
jgi:hypothetical protein